MLVLRNESIGLTYDVQEELSKDVQHINKNKLESMLSLSLVTSTANTDDYKDDLTCQMMNCSALDEVENQSQSSRFNDSRSAGVECDQH